MIIQIFACPLLLFLKNWTFNCRQSAEFISKLEKEKDGGLEKVRSKFAPLHAPPPLSVVPFTGLFPVCL
jgi:hypothetical protein